MRQAARALFLAILTFLSAVVLGVGAVMTSAITVAAYALIVPGTGTHNVNTAIGYKPNARDYYMTHTACTLSDCPNANLIGIDYPASFWPLPFPGWCPSVGCDKWNVSVGTGVTNLDAELRDKLNNTSDPIVIFGYSQGAAVVSNEIRYNLTPADAARVSGVVVGNIDRPNGGLFTRFGFLGRIPILDATLGLPTPTDTINMTDIAFEYDGVSDFPTYPINVLADLNAIAGFAYIHGTYLEPNQNSGFEGLPDGYTKDELLAAINDPANNQGTFEKTTYILIPTKTLPIVMPFLALGAATGTTPIVKPLVDLESPVLRVLIDTGYDRSISPGQYTWAKLIPIINPFKLTTDLVVAVGQGVHDALHDISGGATAVPAPPLVPPLFTDWGPPATTPLTRSLAPQQQLSMKTNSGDAPDSTNTPPSDDTNTGLQTPTNNGSIKTPPTNNGSSVNPFNLVDPTKSSTTSTGSPAAKPKAWKPGAVLQKITTGIKDAVSDLTQPHSATTPGGETGAPAGTDAPSNTPQGAAP